MPHRRPTPLCDAQSTTHTANLGPATLKHEPLRIQDYQRRAYERLAPGRPAPRYFVEAEDALRELWRDGGD
jgi:hypothetical protein